MAGLLEIAYWRFKFWQRLHVGGTGSDLGRLGRVERHQPGWFRWILVYQRRLWSTDRWRNKDEVDGIATKWFDNRWWPTHWTSTASHSAIFTRHHSALVTFFSSLTHFGRERIVQKVFSVPTGLDWGRSSVTTDVVFSIANHIPSVTFHRCKYCYLDATQPLCLLLAVLFSIQLQNCFPVNVCLWISW